MANNFEPTSKDVIDWLAERTNRDGNRINNLEIALIGKGWIDPSILDAPYSFTNGYMQVGGTEELFKYRMFAVDILNVVGTLGAGTDGAVAFTLLPPFWPAKDIHFVGNVLDTSVVLARFDVEAATGEVRVTYT